MKKIFQNGIFTSNILKYIAVALMIIDHIGFYAGGIFPQNINFILRFLGRISMPIFAFFIAQGIRNTKNVNKYMIRLIMFAVCTQVAMFLLGILNNSYFSGYFAPVNDYLNILFSFFICVFAINFIKKKNNLYVTALTIAGLYFIYNFINIELGFRVPILVFGFYYIDELMKHIKYENKLESRIFYMILIVFVIFISVLLGSEDFLFDIPSLISAIFIMLYNGKRGKYNLKIRNSFYYIYMLHHALIYFSSMYFLGR